MQSHSLADTQAFIVDTDGLWIVAQAGVTLKDQRVDTRHAKQVAGGQTGRASAHDDNREKGESIHHIFNFFIASTLFAPFRLRPPSKTVCDERGVPGSRMGRRW